MTKDDIIVAARDCLETPFRHQGRIQGIALDCAGVIVAVANEIGADNVDQQGYGRNPSGGLLESALDIQPCLERVYEKQPGDVLLMRFEGDPQHLAIFTGENIIHAYETIGKVCEHLFTEKWARRIVRIYRFKGVA